MCGFVAVLGPVAHDRVRHASALIEHRGPDAGGYWRSADDRVQLAHRRLSIVDLSPSGAQPMHDDSGMVSIVYNGELYGHLALKAELESRGHVFQGHSDTEVLLRLYLDSGAAMLPRLNGIFAFVIHDARSRTTLVARDRLGIKPLYWMPLEAGGSAFASEIKALLALRGAPPSVEPEVLRDSLSYLWSPQARTMARGVRKFPAGSTMTLDALGNVSVPAARFAPWPHGVSASDAPTVGAPAQGAPDERAKTRAAPFTSETQAVAAIRTTLAAAVSSQMLADVPVGAFLSGGLDSSAIAAYAQRHLGDRRRLQCFTIDFSDTAQADDFNNDLPYARRVATHLGVELHEVKVDADIATELPRMIWQLDEPLADPAPLNVLMIASLARRHDIKVLLSGAGGDDLFTGYRRHYALAQERWWDWLPAGVRRLIAARARAQRPRSTLVRRVAKALQYADLEGDVRIASYFRWMDERTVESLLHPSIRRAPAVEIGAQDPLVASLRDEAKAGHGTVSGAPHWPALQRMLYLECRHFLGDHNLLYTDKMSMAAGVEVRVPLLDETMIAIAQRMPLDYLQRGREGKWILKKAMEDVLPRDVIYRPKTGFGLPLRAWLNGPLRDLVDDLLSPVSIARRGIFDATAVRALIDADRARSNDATYPIFALLCIELWCRIFIDRWGPGQALEPMARAQPTTT